MSTSKQETKTKGMCIATRCTSVDQFVQMFHRFVDEESFFVSTLNTRPPGLETSFSVQLADGTPVLRGLCVVMQAWTTPANPFKTPGVRLGIKRLTANSMAVFERLLVTRSAAKPKPPTPPQLAAVIVAKPGTPKPIVRSPYTETAPAVSAQSRLELKQPARAISEPTIVDPKRAVTGDGIPRAVAAETTDVMEEKTDVREPKLPVGSLASASIAPSSLVPRTIPPLARGSVVASQPTPARPVDVRPVDIKAVDIKAVDIKAVDVKPVAPKPVDLKPVDLKPVDLKPVDLNPVDSKPLGVKEVAKPLVTSEPVADDARTPGSELVLPANPLMNLTDESLEGYVDCTLYEETGNFFPAEDDASFGDDVVPPPPPSGDVAAAADRPSTEIDKRPDTDLAVARYETAPPLATPPMAVPQVRRDSAAVDPEVVARGSAPALPDAPKPPAPEAPSIVVESEHAPTKLPLAPPTGDPTPLPVAAASHLVATPRRKRPSWWLVGGGAGVLAAAAVLVVMTASSNGGARAPSSPPVKKAAANEVLPANPERDPKGERQVDEPELPDVDEPDEPTGSGPPTVGSGPCKVVVHSTPAGSMVKLDGTSVGPSPITVAASCGKHKVDVVHPRYAPGSKVVTLEAGKPEAVELTLSRPTHVVTVTSNPSGAQIFIDGRSAGTTPTKLNVLGFVQLKLEFKKIGYQPASTKLYSKRPQDTIGVKLTKW